MKTFPDFTWEFITRVCELQRNAANQILKLDLPPQIVNREIVTAEAFLSVLPKLQQHLQLGKLVPMLSMQTLRWFPAEGCEIDLYFDHNKAAYIVREFVRVGDSVKVDEENIVPLDQIADEVYAYITKLRDD